MRVRCAAEDQSAAEWGVGERSFRMAMFRVCVLFVKPAVCLCFSPTNISNTSSYKSRGGGGFRGEENLDITQVPLAALSVARDRSCCSHTIRNKPHISCPPLSAAWAPWGK